MKALGLGQIGLALLLLAPARAAEHSWIDPTLLAAAQKEGSLTLYSDINEGEELPLLKMFEDATGIKVDYIRGSDATLVARIAIEARAGKQSWDVGEISAVESLPKGMLLQYVPREAAHLVPAAKDPEGRWNGTYAIYDTPAYNTAKVKPEELPKSYEDFVHHPEWANHVAIDFTDGDWLEGIFNHYGEAKARNLVGEMVRVLKPSLVKGHLAVARAVGAGEYWVALNNYLNLTLNVKLGGAPIDFWVLDPVIATYGKVAASAQAPHPNAAKLGVEFLLSAEAQAQRTTAGRIPTNPDVPTNPPDIRDHFPKTDTVLQSTEDKAKWQKTFDEFFKQ